MEPKKTRENKLTLTVEEAALLLGLSRGLAYEAVHRGEIPCVKVGKRLLIPRVGLEKLLGEPGRPKE